MLYLVLTTLGVACVLDAFLVPVLVSASHRFKWYDNFDARKVHTGVMPDAGGMGIALSTALSIILYFAIRSHLSVSESLTVTRLLPVFCGFLIAHIAGLIDDFSNMKARYKFLIQVVAASIVAFAGFTIRSVDLPWFGITLNLGAAAYFVTIIWLVGISNAINFVDGIDGLAGGVSAIAALFYAVIFFFLKEYVSAAIALALLGAVVGFLFFNWPPARIFMGDSGSLFLGFALAALMLIQNSDHVSLMLLLVAPSLLLLPIMDTFASILRRLKNHVAFYTPDRKHTHHKLLDMGYSQPKILLIMYPLAILPAACMLVWVATSNDAFFWLVAGSWVVDAAFFIVLDRLYRRMATVVSPSKSPNSNPAT